MSSSTSIKYKTKGSDTNVEVFGEDVLYGNDFRASTFGLTADISFSGILDTEETMALSPTANTEFIGGNSHATYLSQKYEAQDELTVTFSHNPCDDEFKPFTEHEVRELNRVLTGKKGYDWLKIVKDANSTDIDYWYYAVVSNISYQFLGKDVIGYRVTFKTDGGQAYSDENTSFIKAKAGVPFYVYNGSDELHDYLRSVVTIRPKSGGTLEITNLSDNNWLTSIENCTENEYIRMDCVNEILTSNVRTKPLNDFNLHWIRLIPDKNEYSINMDADITFTHRLIRKTGFIGG